MIEIALDAFLKNSVELVSLAGRIYPCFGEENAVRPFAIYRRISPTDYNPTLDGISVTKAMIEIAVIADRYKQAVELGAAIRRAKGGGNLQLNGFQGTIDGVVIHSCFVIDERDDYDFVQDGKGKVVYLRLLTLEIYATDL